MDYLGMAAFACIFLGGSMLFGVLAYQLHGWWLKREERRSWTAAIQRDDEYYAGLRESLLQHIDELLKKVDK